MISYTPQQFAESWRNNALGERQGYQIHFTDVCKLVNHEPPRANGIDAKGNIFTFEYGIKKDTGKQGFADVFYENHFAIEYKAPGKYKNLTEAYQQLLQYREKLNNPPLLIVTDIENWEIHTNWPNTEKKVYSFKNADIANQPSVQDILRNIFHAPDRLHPRRNTDQVTTNAARVFQVIADNMRGWEAEPDRIAHFLTKLVFCLFAEDVGLLPARPGSQVGIFSEIIEQTRREPLRFMRYTEELFHAMNDGGEVLFQRIPFFNGALFEDVRVEELSLEALANLESASKLNWESVEPSIFGTLFERSLDPSKRAQLGAHYTSRDDIMLIVEPVLMEPLRREWREIIFEAMPIRARYDELLESASTNRRTIKNLRDQLEALRERMLKRLSEIRVLDPACGSGNFLYVSLQQLMDLEKHIINFDLFAGLQKPFPSVHPRQLYGIEKDPIAHALASIVVWIGYIQWQKNNGYISQREPILEDLHGNIQCMDAILAFDSTGKPIIPDWPEIDVIISNPPFLGSRKLRGEFGNEYVTQLEAAFAHSFGNSTLDLVCYWFERAYQQLLSGKVKRVGLLATNSIRGGTNRLVLDRITESGNIFMAWSDRPWILEGAAVRVSIIGFDDGTEVEVSLDGISAKRIYPNLTSDVNITIANILSENQSLSFQGIVRRGSFDIEAKAALAMINSENTDNEYKNSQLIKPIYNGIDVTRRPRNMWVIDFGMNTPLHEAQKYKLPFEYIEKYVKPERAKTGKPDAMVNWWLHWRPRPEMRNAIHGLERYIATPAVSKHHVMVWLDKKIHPDHALIVFARDDDYFFGVLHSHIHEIWALRMGTWLGAGNDPRYTPTTTFETFPFPWPPGKENTESKSYKAIAATAKQLHEERTAWLNQPGLSEKALKDRTLTNLYNALDGWRGKETIKVKLDAADFAPRLDELHQALDRAVCDAYGWKDIGREGYKFSIYTEEAEEEILRRLLVLNLGRVVRSAPDDTFDDNELDSQLDSDTGALE